jgi:DNA-binding GntR family transcriptional regulator
MAKRTAAKVLAEDIYSAVKEDILNTVIEAGSVLDEVQIMERFSVSRTPAREVIRRLAASGLVTMEPHRSAYVRPLSMTDIADFFEAYLLTQRTVFVLSAYRISRSQLDKATKIQERLEAACRTVNTRAVRELNLQFHSAIAEGCGNAYLMASYEKLLEDSLRLSSMLLRFTAETDWRSHAEGIQKDHQRILSALARRDMDLVTKYSDEHILFFKRQVYRSLERDIPPVPLPDLQQLQRAS